MEPYGPVAQAGLRQGSRIVEICTEALATLTQEQMVYLLKTSETTSVTVVPPHPYNAPRRWAGWGVWGVVWGKVRAVVWRWVRALVDGFGV